MTGAPVPAREEDAFAEVRARAEAARRAGRRIVVVQGLGFVGSAMAAVTASTLDADGTPPFHVVGVDRDTPAGRAKVAALRAGRTVVDAEDPELVRRTREAALVLETLDATTDPGAYALADTVVVDLPLDATLVPPVDAPPPGPGPGDPPGTAPAGIDVDMAGFRRALDPVARRIRPDALVLLESTLPPGTTRSVVVPLFRTVFRARGLTEEPLIAHAFERVMPGPDYATSIHSFWRCFAGASPPAAARARAFLETLVDTRRYPLTELASTTASEVTKVLENSYRAMNIAFIDEWSRAAESVGVDLFEVVAAIRKRAGTHDNIRQPGFGVGGYCLPKDGLVAEWGLRELLGYAGDLPMTRDALGRNRRMPLHALELLRNALGGTLDGRRVGIAGVSYRAAVGDTRNSPAAVFADGARREGASVVASDPRVGAWPERPAIPLVELDELLARCDAVVFGVAHREWRELAPERFGSRPLTVVDAAGLVPDGLRDALVARGHTVVGVGRGDWMPGGTDAAGGGGP